METEVAHGISVNRKLPTSQLPECGVARWQLSYCLYYARDEAHSPKELEAETGLHFDDPSTQCVLGPAEMRVHDVILNVGQVQLVEQIVEVHAKFDFTVFANDFHVGQAKRLAECGVDVEIAGTRESIACNSRTCRQGPETLLAGRTKRRWRIREEAREKSARNNRGSRKH